MLMGTLVDERSEEPNSIPFSKRIGKAFAVAMMAMLVFTVLQVSIPSASADSVHVLRMGWGEVIDSANPFVGLLDPSYIFYGAVYDYLICPDEDLEPTANLASSWWYMDGPTAATQPAPTDFSKLTHNSDADDWPLGSIWEYNLTQGVFWNDGNPFTADDVEFTISIQIGDNFAIFWAYQPNTRWISHAEKVDDYKVRIFYANYDTKEPIAASFGDTPSIPIMPKHVFKDKPATYLAQDWDGTPSIGTGPFMGTKNLKSEVIAKQAVNLVRNPYYNDGLGAALDRYVDIDRLVLQFYSEYATLELDLKTGKIDAAKILPQTYILWNENPGTIPSTLKTVSILTPTGYSKIVGINAYEDAPGTLNPLRLDPAVMRATALATNKQYVIDQVYKGYAVEGVGLQSPVWEKWFWDPKDDPSMSTFTLHDGAGNEIFNYTKPMGEVMAFNLTLANEILDAAGYEWSGTPYASVRKATPLVAERLNRLFGIGEEAVLGPDGTSPKTLSFEVVTMVDIFEDKQIADYILSEWKNIGIYLTTDLAGSADWMSRVYSYTFNVHITYWSGDIDPNYLSFVPTSYSLYGWNDFGTSNETYDEYFLKQASVMDYEERYYWVAKCAEWQYLSGGAILVLVYPQTCYAYNEKRWSDWGDWTEHPNLAIDSFWGAAPIFFSIRWTGEGTVDEVSTLMIVGVLGAVAAVAVIIVVASILAKKKRLKEEEEGPEEEESPEQEIKPPSP